MRHFRKMKSILIFKQLKTSIYIHVYLHTYINFIATMQIMCIKLHTSYFYFYISISMRTILHITYIHTLYAHTRITFIIIIMFLSLSYIQIYTYPSIGVMRPKWQQLRINKHIFLLAILIVVAHVHCSRVQEMVLPFYTDFRNYPTWQIT